MKQPLIILIFLLTSIISAFGHRNVELKEIPSDTPLTPRSDSFTVVGSEKHTVAEMEAHGYDITFPIEEGDISVIAHSGDYSRWFIGRRKGSSTTTPTTSTPTTSTPTTTTPTLTTTTTQTLPLVATKLVKISGGNQQGAPGEELANPFVVAVQDQNGRLLAGVTVTFAVTAGGGTLSATTPTTDANGQAQTTLTLGSMIGTNSVEASVEGIDQTQVFSAEATLIEAVRRTVADTTGGGPGDRQLYQFELQLQQGWNLIHLPLTVYAVNNELHRIQTAAELYELIQPTFMFIHSSEEGFMGTHEETDIILGPNQGIVVLTDAPATFTLIGTRLPDSFRFERGLNLVGLPRQSDTLQQVSDFLGVYEEAFVVVTTVDSEFSVVGRAADPGDHEITGGQSFFIIMTAPRETHFFGPSWGTPIE